MHEKAVAEEAQLDTLRQAVGGFASTEHKAVIPQNVLERIDRQFKEIDICDTGFVSAEDICAAWAWTGKEVSDLLEEYDANEDQYIDQTEFRRMMCPPEYR